EQFLELNGVRRGPLNRDNGETRTLHRQLCDLLGMPTTDFIGFGVSYPWYQSGNVGYNSGTCNNYQFGMRELPVVWQDAVNVALAHYLPAGALLGTGSYRFNNPGTKGEATASSLLGPSPNGTILAYPLLGNFQFEYDPDFNNGRGQFRFGR